MSSRSQRFGPRIGGWRRRPSVAHAPTLATPTLTEADRAAGVFDVHYTAKDTGVGLSFPVLAFDRDHAITLGDMRVETRYSERQITPWIATTSATKRETASDEYRLAILGIEGADEWKNRQVRYERTQDGPEYDPNGLGMEGGVNFKVGA